MSQRPVFYAKGDPRLPGPETGAERMASFRRRHPDYDRKRHAMERAHRLEFMAALQAAKAEVHAAATIPIPTFQLCLPAPVVDPTMEALAAIKQRLSNLQHIAA